MTVYFGEIMSEKDCNVHLYYTLFSKQRIKFRIFYETSQLNKTYSSNNK